MYNTKRTPLMKCLPSSSRNKPNRAPSKVLKLQQQFPKSPRLMAVGSLP